MLYVLETTLEDWSKVLAMLAEATYGALLNDEPLHTPLPDPQVLFATHERSLLLFHIGGVEVACHFFAQQQIEFDFDPRGLVEADLRDLLDFMERGAIHRRVWWDLRCSEPRVGASEAARRLPRGSQDLALTRDR